jgi:hypothetical protein
MGINEKLIFNVAEYVKKTAYGIVPNFFGLMLFSFGVVAITILVKPEYKREENRSLG